MKSINFKFLATFLLTMQVICMLAQNHSKDILFHIDNENVYAAEFIRIYNKNLELVKDESQKDIDTYLDLFINYKLKLKEAKALELDKQTAYINELNNYKNQLIKNYVSKSEVTNSLLQEAYHRTVNEVHAKHILIRFNEADSTQAYNDILALRNRALKEGFETVSNDLINNYKSKNGKDLSYNKNPLHVEDLGYFTAFKMVYPFESAAYNTPIGEISQPFKTQFGYHIVYVVDKRKSRGQREVAHIMINNENQDAATKIQELYKKLEQGEDFSDLAKQFSEDQSSAKTGGKLAVFSGGDLRSSIFEDQAFLIKNIGDYTKPFKTEFGWHIVKLIDKIEFNSFEELLPTLESKIKRDSRSKLINNARIKQLKQQYKINNVANHLKYFSSILNANYYKQTWELPEDFPSEKTFLKIENKSFNYQDFGTFLVKSQRRPTTNNNFDTLVQEIYNIFLESKLIQYQEENLENENQEYAEVLNEYRDGLLLFNLMDKKIWKAAKEDTAAIKEFYQNNKQNYFYNTRIDAIIATSAKEKDIKKVVKFLEQGKTENEIKNTLNTKSKIKVIFTSGILENNHQALPKDFLLKKGVSKIYQHNNSYIVALVNNILPKTQQTFQEAQGRVTSDYQEFKEKSWLKELHKKYNVTVNQETLKTVKEKLK